MHGTLRRTDDVYRHVEPPWLLPVRPDVPVHGGDGRVAMPHRDHAAGDCQDAHGPSHGEHILGSASVTSENVARYI